MKYFVCIETSGEVCSIALCSTEGQVITEECWEKNSHSKYLTIKLESLFEQYIASKEEQILGVAVSEGPGSYTGLRIGVSTAKGIAYALDKPLMAISTLRIMLESLKVMQSQLFEKADFFVPMIDARRMEVYLQIFDKQLNPYSDVYNLVLDNNSFSDILQQGTVIFFGNGARKFQDIIEDKNAIFVSDIVPLARYMSPLVLTKYSQKDFVDVAYFEPFYLKPFIPTTKPKDLLGNA